MSNSCFFLYRNINNMLTKAKLLRMPAKKYMAKEQLEFFTAQLTEQKAEALSEIEDARQRLRVPPECKDEADRASFEMDSQLYLRIVDRKSKLVKKIDFALRRIKLANTAIAWKQVNLLELKG